MVSRSISHYRIIKELGAGGMGKVYLAQDTTELGRNVAIKVLGSEKASDENRLTRFIQEAKTASSFNHPNILTIYEIGEADSKRFIVMEFIDGETLRQRLARSHLDLREALNVAIQTASALVAAHKGRIVHRDIKPENIMLRWDDGLVKVLDFGLAKPTETPQGDIDTEASTQALGNTAPGMIVGTVLYMSPEQARGQEVDERTDVWSLGVVLYEMVAGKVPFLGGSKNEVISAILSREQPAPLARFAHDVPDRLEEIVTKALTKDREERYQTAKDLLIDLKRLKQKLEVDAEIERSVAPEVKTMSGTAMPTGAQEVISTTRLSIARSSAGEVVHTASSAEYIVQEIKHHRRGMAIALAALVLISFAGSAYYLYSARTSKAIDSIVVLPLINASNDPNTEYLSDGLSESLINSLAGLRQLRVIARTTAFRYKGKEIDPQAVGRELNVRSVLTGQVRQMGDSTNIQVDLVDATTGAQLWGEEYERKTLDVLSVKQAVAREVTDKLRLRLSGEEQHGLVRRDTTNAEAYQSYLRGRHFWNGRTAVGIRKAIEQFQQAIVNDSNYALAYVGLADCYLVAEEYIGTPATETVPKARAAAERALQIDDSLAEAHASLARVHEKMWQWEEAGKQYERAISLNPNYPTARHWYSIYLRAVGKLDQAAVQIKRAQELDPLSAAVGANVAEMHMLQGEFDAAIEHCQRIIELYPNYPGIYRILATTYLRQRRYSEAIAEESKALELSGRSSWYLGELGYCYALAGNRSEALAILSEMEERYARREANAAYLAMVHAALGDKDKAFAWLEKDFQSRAGTLGDLSWDPYFDLFRSDPRYNDFLKRMGLKP